MAVRYVHLTTTRGTFSLLFQNYEMLLKLMSSTELIVDQRYLNFLVCKWQWVSHVSETSDSTGGVPVKLVVTKVAKKLSAFYETRKFFTLFVYC